MGPRQGILFFTNSTLKAKLMNISFFIFLTTISFLFSNPFHIDFEDKENLNTSDWIEVQKKLRKIDIAPTLEQIYPTSQKNKRTWFTKPELKQFSDFLGRMSRGTKQTLIDESCKKVPIKQLLQINQGGDSCVVSFASYDGTYADQINTITKHLETTGFNGHFLLMTGGFPNPTGKEIQYAGVPYCFKIFALLEAKKLGFQKVLWIDSALQPLHNLKPIFDQIEKNGSFFQLRKNATRYLLPYTRDVILKETSIDMYHTKSVRARIIGLNFQSPQVQELVEEYYRLVKLGTPFMSCFPEEHVLGALVAKHPEKFPANTLNNLVKNEKKLHGKTIQWVQDNNYFFLLRGH